MRGFLQKFNHAETTCLISPILKSNDDLLKIVKIGVDVIDSKILMSVNIPLLDSKVYKLYKMYPNPVQLLGERQGAIYIEPRADYLLVSPETYTLARATEIARCQTLGDKHHICQVNEPFYSIKSQPICETSILTETPKFDDCNVKIKQNFKSYWKKVNLGWLYSLSTPAEITIICSEGWVNAINITGNGILRLKPECYASFDGFFIEGCSTTI